jgi:hypothetical protein
MSNVILCTNVCNMNALQQHSNMYVRWTVDRGNMSTRLTTRNKNEEKVEV